jgi:hypothetical protein
VDSIILHALLLLSVPVLKDHHFFYRSMHHINAGARFSPSLTAKHLLFTVRQLDSYSQLNAEMASRAQAAWNHDLQVPQLSDTLLLRGLYQGVGRSFMNWTQMNRPPFFFGVKLVV